CLTSSWEADSAARRDGAPAGWTRRTAAPMASPSSASSARAPQRAGRRADLDWLRVLAMVVVFLAHVSMVFSPWQDYHVQSATESRALGTFTVLAWPWVLPLFMLLAGSASWYGLERRSARTYLRERFLRIFVPLVVGTMLVAPPQMYLRRWSRGEFEGSFLEFLPHFFLDGPYPEGNLSATHLWFLGYLFTYALAALPLFLWLRGSGGPVLRRVHQLLSTRYGIVLWLLLPLVVSQVWLRGPYPQNNRFVGDWANHAWLGLTFLYGFLLASGETPRRTARSVWPLAAAIGAVASAWMTFMLLREDLAAGEALTRQTASSILLPRSYSPKYVLWWTLFSVASWSWLLFFVGVADRFLKSRPPFLAWASPTIYPFYVFHQLVIVVAAAWILRWPLWWVADVGALAVVALAGTLALCEVTRRWGPASRLFGLRHAPAH
ncbi:MAG TPA: acyltransferase, partial [Longimicrobiales bacterium]|nr:acyltransferase [Longimicrobiales bacterium]